MSTTKIREEYNQDLLAREKRNRFLKYLVQEAIINTIAEQQQPAMPVAPNPATAAQPAPMPDPNAAVPPPADPNAATPPQPGVAQQEEFTLDKMIEKLNVIRGGRSFTDPEIYGQLTTLFKGWDDQTKQSIQKTFDEIAKIVTLNAPEGQAGQEAAPNPMDQQPMPGSPPPAAPPTGAPSPVPPTPPVG